MLINTAVNSYFILKMSNKFNAHEDRAEDQQNFDLPIGRSFLPKQGHFNMPGSQYNNFNKGPSDIIGAGENSTFNYYMNYNMAGKDGLLFNSNKNNEFNFNKELKPKEEEDPQSGLETLMGNLNLNNLNNMNMIGNGSTQNTTANQTSDMLSMNQNFFNTNFMGTQQSGTPGSTPNAQTNTQPNIFAQRRTSNDSGHNLDNLPNAIAGNWMEEAERKIQQNSGLGLANSGLSPAQIPQPQQASSYLNSNNSNSIPNNLMTNLDIQNLQNFPGGVLGLQNLNGINGLGTIGSLGNLNGLMSGQNGMELGNLGGLNNLNGMNSLNGLGGLNTMGINNLGNINNLFGLMNQNLNLQGLNFGLGLNQLGQMNQMNQFNQHPQINQINHMQNQNERGKGRKKNKNNYNNSQNKQNLGMQNINNILQGQNKNMLIKPLLVDPSLFQQNPLLSQGMSFPNQNMQQSQHPKKNPKLKTANGQNPQNKGKRQNNKKEQKDFTEEEVREKAAELAKDHGGSMAVQEMYEKGGKELKDKIFKKLQPEILPLSKDVFGNYAIQKLLPDINEKDSEEVKKDNSAKATLIYKALYGKIFDLSTNMYGCRVIQQLIKVIDPIYLPSVTEELKPNN